MNRQQRRARERDAGGRSRGSGSGSGASGAGVGVGPDAGVSAARRQQADRACAQGWQAHHQGQGAAAEAAYREALHLDPNHAAALHLLGVLAQQAGHPAAAVELIGRALAVEADSPEVWSNFGAALQALHRLHDAAAAYQQALTLRPDYPLACFNLGTVYRELGEPAAAAAAFRHTLARQPAHAGALGNLGGLYHLHPELVPAERAGRTGNGEDAASRLLRWSLHLYPDDVDALANLGACAEAEGGWAQAARLYRRALALAPAQGETLYNLGNCLRDLGDLPGAARAFRQALALQPAHSGAQWNLGLLQLELRGPGPERWRRYAGRLHDPTLQDSRPPPLPPWHPGQPHTTRPLVWREQGVGDEILFSALYGTVPTGGAASSAPAAEEPAGTGMVIACDPRLQTLFARSFPGAQVIGTPAQGAVAEDVPFADLAGADSQCAAGSLASILGPTLPALTTVLAAARPASGMGGWLIPDARRQARWAERLAALGPQPKIGLAWRSGLAGGRRAGSYRPLCAWEAILTVPGVTFVSLQYGATAAARRAVARRFGVSVLSWPDLDLRDDFEETAALTAALDLVITAPTAAGELAAALGVPTWRITTAGDWSVLGTAVRPAYPSMRLFRPRPGEGLEQALADAGQTLRDVLARMTDPECVCL